MPTNRRTPREGVSEEALGRVEASEEAEILENLEAHEALPNLPEKETTLADIEADIRQLREDVAALARQLGRTTERTYDNARQVAADGIDQLRVQGEQALDTLRTSARDVEAEVIRNVREKPVTALAIAAAFGYLVALFTRR